MTNYGIILHWSDEIKPLLPKCPNCLDAQPMEQHAKMRSPMLKWLSSNGSRRLKNSDARFRNPGAG